ncbi:MAG TPA: SH3 domain-containing protein [Lachnospiraceae bacterium]
MRLKRYIYFTLLLGAFAGCSMSCQKADNGEAKSQEVKVKEEKENKKEEKVEEEKERGSKTEDEISISKGWESVDFISANQSISMKLPSKDWILQVDSDEQRLFTYENLGSISIVHLTGDKAKGILAMKTQEEVYDYLRVSGYDMGELEILEYITGVEGAYDTCSYAFSFSNKEETKDENKEKEEEEESLLESVQEDQEIEDRTYVRVYLWKSEVEIYEVTAILDKPDLMTIKAVADAMNTFTILKDSEETMQAKSALESQKQEAFNAQMEALERQRMEEEAKRQEAYAAADASGGEILPVYPFEIVSKKGVHIRTEADNKSQILGDLPAGSTVTVIGMNKNWYQFEYNGSIVYASRKFF